MWSLRFWLVAAAAFLVVACGSERSDVMMGGDGGAAMEPGGFGAECTGASGCESSLCVRIDELGGVCTESCETDGDCPNAPNWKCVEPSNVQVRVCACQPDADAEICGDEVDNDCDGRIDDCMVCDGVQVDRHDPAHCSECNNACRADQQCADGACTCAEAGTVDCGGQCVDLENDRRHCGACGNACPGDLECTAGTCECPPSTPDRCGDQCVRFRDDVANCGSCGRSCRGGRTCQAGACECPSSAPDVCGNECVDTLTDERHCGQCFETCPGAQTCNAGVCGCPDAGQALCGDQCIDVASDARHCGDCLTRCVPGELCSSGTCMCPSGLFCDGACVPVGDVDNCGACGNECGPEQVCSGTGCTCAASGLTACGTDCFDLQSDPAHCGTCTTTCQTGEICYQGSCQCPYGSTWCDSANACVDLKSDPQNCGGCGTACETGLTCNSGTCGCPVFGQRFCAEADACIDTLSDTQNCGDCGATCRNGEVCEQGRCTCPTNDGIWCASVGDCVASDSDETHCGECDNACPTGSTCSNGDCRCPSYYQTLCPTGCTDTRSDSSNCGACGEVCPGTSSCSESVCACVDHPPTSSAPQAVTNVYGNHRYLDVAASSSQVAIAWTNNANGDVYVRLSSPEGVPTGSEILVNPNGTSVGRRLSIAWSGTEWAVAWISETAGTRTVVVRRLTAAGAFVDATPVEVSLATDEPEHVSIEWVPGRGYVIVYNGSGTMRLRDLGTDLSAPQTPVTVTSSTVYEQYPARTAVAPDGTLGLLVQGSGGLYFATWSPSNQLSDFTAVPGATSGSMHSDLTHDGVTWVAIYLHYRSVYVARGATVQHSRVVNDDTSTSSYAARIDAVDGYVYAAWMHGGTTTTKVQFVRLNRPATSDVAVKLINPPTSQPAPQHDILGMRYAAQRQVMVTGDEWLELDVFSADYSGCP